MSRFALVSKSYRGDIELFANLCRSIDRHMPDARHYVLVDHSDMPQFESFATERREVIDCSALLPSMREFGFSGHRLWWHPPFTLVRGWIYQQLAKIAFVSNMQEDCAVLVDSDLYLLAALTPEHIFCAGQPRLYRNPGGGRGKRHREWHLTAQRVLGLPQTGYQGYDYIGQGVVWSPPVVRAMIARIEAVAGRPWHEVLAARFRFSEYLLYGIFCDQFVGQHQGKVCRSSESFWHMSWHYDLSNDGGIDAFVEAVAPQHVGLLIQSNLRMDITRRKAIIARIERVHGELSR